MFEIYDCFMRFKICLLFILLILIESYSFTFKYEISNKDSLLNNLHTYSIDSLINISKGNKFHDFDSAELLLLSANYLADSLRETDNQIKALILLGHLYFDNGYFENADAVYNTILKDFFSDLSDEQLADVNHTLGLNHIRFNNYNKAINLFQEALLFYEKTQNRVGIAKALKDIGQVYYYLGNENTALDNYQKALLIFREVNDSDGIARIYNNIGLIFKEKGNVKLALDYLNQSLEIKKRQENTYGIANTLGNMGDAHMTNGEYDKAIKYFSQALEMWFELEYLHGITEVYNYLGEVYIKKGNYDKAILNLLECQKISLENNFKQRLTVNSQLLSEAYFKKSDFKNAFEYLQKYNVLKDSLYQSLSNQKIEEYLIKYENIKAENELIAQDKKIMQQRFQISAIIVILIVVIVFLILIIRQNRTIRRKSRKIQNINKELDNRVYKKTTELRISRFSIDIAVDAIIWIKRNGNIAYVNNAACSMLGYSKEDLNKMTIFDLVSEFSEDIWQEYWLQLKNKRSYVIQLFYTTRMGNEIPVEVAFNFQEFEGEEFNFSYSRNITERKISEEKLKNAKEKAERSDKLKSAFLANMSHEIRTPMNAINGFINLLGDPDINEDQKNEIVEYAQSSSNDLLNIVNDIIDISKIEADELAINRSLNYVNRLVNDIYKLYLKDIYFKDKEELKLRLQLEPGSERIAVFTDQNRFRQIMNNLINNAIKFTEKGEIIIGYRQIKKGNRKLLSFFVKDSGIGIPEKKQKIIFNRFNQLSDDRNKTFKGTGLGLAISKKLVDLLGGSIGVNSVEGIGSEFYFTIPYQVLDNPDEDLDHEFSNSKQKHIWEDKTILIVEDTPSNYYLVENYLRSTRLQLIWAKSGKEAIELFKNNKKFDLILMDIQLPGINGYEATKLIKAYNNKIPVIAQTAYALSGEKENSIKEGCDDYISKPIKKETLIELLGKYFQ